MVFSGFLSVVTDNLIRSLGALSGDYIALMPMVEFELLGAVRLDGGLLP